MMVWRVFPLVAMLVAIPFAAGAQFGDRPDLPGVPPNWPSTELPAVCRQLTALNDETQMQGRDIQKAHERRASVKEACDLFANFLVTQAKFIGAIEDHGQTCGAPPDLLKQMKAHHKETSQMSREFCPWPPGDYGRPRDRQRSR